MRKIIIKTIFFLSLTLWLYNVSFASNYLIGTWSTLQVYQNWAYVDTWFDTTGKCNFDFEDHYIFYSSVCSSNRNLNRYDIDTWSGIVLKSSWIYYWIYAVGNWKIYYLSTLNYKPLGVYDYINLTDTNTGFIVPWLYYINNWLYYDRTYDRLIVVWGIAGSANWNWCDVNLTTYTANWCRNPWANSPSVGFYKGPYGYIFALNSWWSTYYRYMVNTWSFDITTDTILTDDTTIEVDPDYTQLVSDWVSIQRLLWWDSLPTWNCETYFYNQEYLTSYRYDPLYTITYDVPTSTQYLFAYNAWGYDFVLNAYDVEDLTNFTWSLDNPLNSFTFNSLDSPLSNEPSIMVYSQDLNIWYIKMTASTASWNPAILTSCTDGVDLTGINEINSDYTTFVQGFGVNCLLITFDKAYFADNEVFDIDFWIVTTDYVSSEICQDPATWDVTVDWTTYTWSINDLWKIDGTDITSIDNLLDFDSNGDWNLSTTEIINWWSSAIKTWYAETLWFFDKLKNLFEELMKISTTDEKNFWFNFHLINHANALDASDLFVPNWSNDSMQHKIIYFFKGFIYLLLLLVSLYILIKLKN